MMRCAGITGIEFSLPFVEQGQRLLRITDFINYDFIKYPIYNLNRSIPALLDGLKPSQRKILWSIFLKWKSSKKTIGYLKKKNIKKRKKNKRRRKSKSGKYAKKMRKEKNRRKSVKKRKRKNGRKNSTISHK